MEDPVVVAKKAVEGFVQQTELEIGDLYDQPDPHNLTHPMNRLRDHINKTIDGLVVDLLVEQSGRPSSFQEWLREQLPEFQNLLLGEDRAERFRRGQDLDRLFAAGALPAAAIDSRDVAMMAYWAGAAVRQASLLRQSVRTVANRLAERLGTLDMDWARGGPVVDLLAVLIADLNAMSTEPTGGVRQVGAAELGGIAYAAGTVRS